MINFTKQYNNDKKAFLSQGSVINRITSFNGSLSRYKKAYACSKTIRKYLRLRADTDLPLSRISPLFMRLLPAIVSTICVPSFSVVAIIASTSAAPASRVIPRRSGSPFEPEASTPRSCR